MPGLGVTRIDHCTVIVTDVGLAREFYGQKLGLREIAPPKEFDFVAVWFDLGGCYLHLLEKPQPDPVGARHFCLCVEDLAAARAHVRAAGVEIEETVKIAAADRFFVRDPFGNRVEILQWLRAYDPEADGAYPRRSGGLS